MDIVKQNINELSYNHGNKLKIYSGEAISPYIFKDKYEFSNYPNYMNLIPLITSIFSVKPEIWKISKTIYGSLIHINKRKIKNEINKDMNRDMNRDNEITINQELLETYYQYNDLKSNNLKSENQYLVKFYNKKVISNILFACNQKYNFKIRYLRIEWKNIDCDYLIFLDLYDDYFKISININIPEKVEMVPLRKKKIMEQLSLFDKIISQLKINN